MIESELYDTVINALVKDIPRIYLEITASGIREYIKEVLDDEALAITNKEGQYPDLMGWLGSESDVVIVEIKQKLL